MATKKSKIEYGLVVGNISTVNSDSTVTKAKFFEELERQYPSTEGWEVYATQTAALTGQVFTVSYHVRKVNE
jgi:hypothetical protein